MPDLPDFFSTFIVKGWDGAAYQTVRVTDTGEMYILISALFAGGITGLQCDVDGNLRMNVKAQDLAEVINRPKYGACNGAIHDAPITAPGNTTLYTIVGKGIAYCGYLTVYVTGESHNVDFPQLVVDGTTVTYNDMMFMSVFGLTKHPASFFTLMMYDEVNWHYSLLFATNITFETSFEIKWTTLTADACKIRSELLYALV